MNEVKESRDGYLRRTGEKTGGVRKMLSNVSTWMWNCEDLINGDYGNESIEFTGLLQVGRLLTDDFHA